MNVKDIAKNIYWKAYGKTISNPKLPKCIGSILFVCLGNICRSPFAEKYAAVNFRSTVEYDFSSAGIQGEFPRPAPVEAIEAAKYFGVDLNGHRSRRLDKNMMESSDIILVMDVWQYNYMNRAFHGIRNKLFLLPLYENNTTGFKDKYFYYNIKDPYGKNISDYTECYRRIVNCLSVFMKGIRK